jgi:hypothetical protein
MLLSRSNDCSPLLVSLPSFCLVPLRVTATTFLSEDLFLTIASPVGSLSHGWPVVGDNGVICQTMPDTHTQPTFKAVREVIQWLRSKTNTSAVLGEWKPSSSCFGSLHVARCAGSCANLRRGSCRELLRLSAIQLPDHAGRLRLRRPATIQPRKVLPRLLLFFCSLIFVCQSLAEITFVPGSDRRCFFTTRDCSDCDELEERGQCIPDDHSTLSAAGISSVRLLRVELVRSNAVYRATTQHKPPWVQ